MLVFPGMNVSVGTHRAIRRRISFLSVTMPAAFACTMQFPMAVASEGPATTGMPMTSAVMRFKRAFFEPPPITCSFRSGTGPFLAGYPAPARNAWQGLKICIVRTGSGSPAVFAHFAEQNEAMAADMLSGFEKRASSGFTVDVKPVPIAPFPQSPGTSIRIRPFPIPGGTVRAATFRLCS